MEGVTFTLALDRNCSGLEKNQIPCQGDYGPNTTWGPSAPAVQAQGDKVSEEFAALLHLRDYVFGSQVQVLKIREQRTRRSTKQGSSLSAINWGKVFQNKSLHFTPIVLPVLRLAPLSVMGAGSRHQVSEGDDDHDDNGTSFVVHILCAKNCHKYFSNITSFHPIVL